MDHLLFHRFVREIAVVAEHILLSVVNIFLVFLALEHMFVLFDILVLVTAFVNLCISVVVVVVVAADTILVIDVEIVVGKILFLVTAV